MASLRGIGAGAGEHLDFAGGELHGQLDDADVLLAIHRGRFAGGADGHDAVHAALDLDFDQAFERGLVNRAVAERRDNGGVSSGEHISP